ncbi:hypothetical protein HGM15179_000147, partial [Zosterops borbonicus]
TLSPPYCCRTGWETVCVTVSGTLSRRCPSQGYLSPSEQSSSAVHIEMDFTPSICQQGERAEDTMTNFDLVKKGDLFPVTTEDTWTLTFWVALAGLLRELVKFLQ